MFITPRVRITAALVIIGAIILAAAPARAADFGGGIITGTIGDATSMIPMITSDSASHEMSGLCYSGLLKYDRNLNLVGELAESWEVSPDGLTITFRIRKGVLFHDGKPYTSADALFNYQFMVDPKTPTAYSGDYLQVATAEAPDPHTFRVTYKKPYAPGLSSWTLPQMPAHLLRGVDVRKSPLNRHPIGTGPYRFSEWKPGVRVMLRYFDKYFEGRPNLDQVIFRIIPDMATLFLELRSGGIDRMGLTAIQYRRQTNTEFFKANYRKYRYPSASYVYLGYNLRDPRFQDKRVRQALSYAIDKREIIKGVLLGLGQVATGPFKPGTEWYNSKVRRYPYDPKRALKLLAEAGWIDTDKDGWLDKDGKRFEFVIMTNQGNQYRANTSVIIQHRLAKIGIKVNLRVIEWSAFLAEFLNKGRFEAIVMGWTIPPDPDLYAVWHSDNIGPGKLNMTAFRNAELDRLTIKARGTFDQKLRKAYMDRIQEILAEDQPYTFLYVPDALPVVAARIKGIKPAPAGISYDFIRWWVPKAQQRHQLTR